MAEADVPSAQMFPNSGAMRPRLFALMTILRQLRGRFVPVVYDAVSYP